MLFECVVSILFIGSSAFVIGPGSSNSTAGWENIFAYNKSSILPLTHYGDKSYYFGYYIKATYLQAMQFCDDIHMKLLSIRNQEENARIYKHIRDANRGVSYWTSGAKLLDGHNWVWMAYGMSVEYTNWGPGQPDNNQEQCLQVDGKNGDLYWNDMTCDARGYFICEREHPTLVVEHTDTERSRWLNLMETPSISANIALLHHNKKRYFFARHIKTNYMQAIQFCKIINMELVSITSKEENDRLSKYIRDTHAGDHWWSSGSKLLDKKSWVWFTRGKAIEYTNWKAGEPNSELELCLHLVHDQNRGLEWTDDYCHYQYKVICESYENNDNTGSTDWGILNTQAILGGGQTVQNGGSDPNLNPQIEIRNGGINENNGGLISPTTPKTTSTTTRYIPPGGFNDEDWLNVIKGTPPGLISFRYYEGNKYHVEIELIATQMQAAQFCSYHNMQLIEINDAAENDVVERLLLDTGASGPYWTSGQNHVGSWIWTTSKQPLSYTNWNSHISGVKKTGRNCLQVDQAGKWNEEFCTNKLYFICEAQMYSNTVPDLNGQCSQPVVNVYINTNLVTEEGTKNLKNDIITSKDVSANDRGFQVLVNNNVDIKKKDDDVINFR